MHRKKKPVMMNTTGVRPERVGRHQAERVVDRRADVPVSRREEGVDPQDPLQSFQPASCHAERDSRAARASVGRRTGLPRPHRRSIAPARRHDVTVTEDTTPPWSSSTCRRASTTWTTGARATTRPARPTSPRCSRIGASTIAPSCSFATTRPSRSRRCGRDAPGNAFKDVVTGEPDVLITKHTNSCFYGEPDLHHWLQQRGINACSCADHDQPLLRDDRADGREPGL